MAKGRSRAGTVARKTLATTRGRRRARRTDRRLRLEHLEDRRLLAVELAAIATNQGALLRDGLVLNVAPRELQFRFNDDARLDPATLASGIEIIRSGGDGTFESASVRSDLNTGGQVVMEFRAVQPHSAGDGLQLVFSKNDRGPAGGVGIDVQGAIIKIDLNTATGAETTALSLRSAINLHPLASQLIEANIVRGNPFTNIAAPAITYSPLVLGNANHARASTNFNQGNAVEVEFVAVQPGIQGNGIRIHFAQSNFGGAGAPRISVVNRTITITLNTNPGNESTAAAVVGAVNADPAARQLVRATQIVGSPAARVTSSTAIASLLLAGANDVVIPAGFIGLGATPNVAVFRFAETLPDDFYRVNILARPGGGRQPVADVNGTLFRDGRANASLGFELDLAPQVLSVVPQPVTRNASGQLVQARNQIHVYFNDDDLDPESAQNPNFYQLIATNDTVRNTDDVVFRPISVQYDRTTDRAILTFAANLEDLLGPGVPTTFRLRIGTDEMLPLAPVPFDPGVDAGSSFTTAVDLRGIFETGPVLVVREDGRGLRDGQTIAIASQAGTERVFEFEDTIRGPLGVQAGHVPVPFSDNSTADDIAQALANAINNTVFGVTATANGTQVFLSGDQRVVIDSRITAVGKTTQGLIVSGSIDNTGQPFRLNLPGAISEPGHRDIPVENHFILPQPDSVDGITTDYYNFQRVYGVDPQGNELQNAITEVQKQRVREIFELYSRYLGIQFIESATRGMTIAVGDMRAIDPTVPTGPGGVLGIADPVTRRLVMDLQDFDRQNDEYGGEFFQTAMHEIGHLLGLGHSTELPPITLMSGFSQPITDRAEPIFPGDHDIVHGRFLFRPESKDIDLYKFEVTQRGLFTAETIAERLPDDSHLDTVLTLYRETVNGRELVARNDDYFSRDSFLELLLEPGTYYVGVSASGNGDYDPNIEDSGFGGRTQGAYQLRLNFRSDVTNSIFDADNRDNPAASAISARTALDGDGDGVPGGVFNYWFRVQTLTRTIFVDKTAPTTGADGSLSRPFNRISTALAAARPGDIVRIVGNGGADGDITTLQDNLAYEVGFSALGGQPLADGTTLEVPKGVTVMVDAGAVIKLRRARIGVGSSAVNIDRSAGALQVLGTPRVIDAAGNVKLDEFGQPVVGNVLFTSLHERVGVGTNPDPNPPAPAAGDWGGLVFRADLDHRDTNRFSYEKQGIFLNQVYFADIRYGGGNVNINGVPTRIDPVHIVDTRPAVAYSTITRSAHAAISANPNSFEESNFHSPEFQKSGVFSSDYQRLGPDIHGNRVVNNTINGLFVRITTAPGAQPETLTTSARWDETDIVYVLQENLTVAGTPGGPILEGTPPPVTLVKVSPGTAPGGTLAPGDYNYRITFVDASGTEGPVSDVTRTVSIPGNPDVSGSPNVGTIVLDNLPTVANFPGFVARRIYRSTAGGTGPYTLVAEINATSRTFVDDGTTRGGELREVNEVVRGRLDGRLRLDAGVIVKSEGALVTLGMGANLIAEGSDGQPIVFTALTDRRYGAGGTFNTGGNANAAPQPGTWAGIYAGPASSLSVDHGVLAYAGGTARLEGAFRSFNVVEIHQADARVANSVFEFNDHGFQPVDNNPQSVESRFGRGFNREATIFVRGAQPILINNILRHNAGPAISINVNSLNADLVHDWGRSTGTADVYPLSLGNRGPLVAGNRLDDNAINGMVVRAGVLTTESVWDDTDIVHVIFDSIDVPDFHTFGGLRLVSKSNASLVIKARGPNAGFTVAGQPLDIDDRIGGAIQILGQPRHPVVITSLEDCSVGAGFTPNGTPQTDTHNSGLCGQEVGVPYADIVVVMDESGSMAFAQQFSVGLVAALDAGLAATGVGDGTRGINRFGLVGFGDLNVVPRAIPVGAGGALFGTSSEYAIAAGQLTETGAIEDGWLALHFTVDTYLPAMRPEAAKFVILITNEDRDQVDPTATFANTLAKLQSAGIKLEGILSVQIVDANNNQALALDADGNSYTEDGSGGFIKAPGGRFLPGFDTTIPDYANMVHALGGIVGDIDQIQVGGLTAVSFANALVSSVVQQAGGIPAQPGDWRSVRLEEYSHDRNVDRVVEIESTDGALPDTNNTPDRAEFLGDLAPHEKAGDETLRLGFVVDGTINNPRDVDVYRFTAEAGTEVWLDIDRTWHALDSVVELITAEGIVLARSDNSFAEAANPALLFRDSSLPPQTINPLQKSVFDGVDRYSTNPRDAGLRIVLPGVAGTRGNYYVRVRSSSPDLNDLTGGLTRGAYQLQVRLRELDEVPGSLVRGADIRFATTGIEVLGQPIHSPLTGEITEDTTPNNTLASAQRMGNLLQTDRAALGIAGALGPGGDVDFYQFDARYVQVQQTASPTNPQWVYATFDVDYADGLGRPSTMVSIFDQNGNLVLTGLRSNVAEDQPGPLAGVNMDDLSRGSAGKLDPFIGPVALPVGTYSVAVSPVTQIPAELGQFTSPNPVNPLLRLEPINSVRRIAEDHIDSSGGSTADPPVVPVLLDRSSVVPWTLSDITLYVSQDPGTVDQTNLYTVDPFTGRRETIVGRFNFDIGDIAFRPNGDLMSFSLDLENPPPSDATAGVYIRIDTGTAAATVVGSSGIETYEDDPANPGNPVRSNLVGGNRIGHGIHFQALAFGHVGDGIERGFAVGGRPAGVFPPGISVTQNVLYEFSPSTGAATSSPASDRSGAQLLQGAGTQIVERGDLDTAADPFGRRNTVIVAPEATSVDALGFTRFIVQDGTRFTIVQGPLARFFEFVSGPEIILTLNPSVPNPSFLRDGDTFFLDGVPFEIDTGEVFVMDAISGSFIQDGDRFTVSDNQTVPVTRIFEWDNGSGPPIGPNIIPVPFNVGMTQGQLVNAMVAAINSQTQPGVFNASAARLSNTNRISLINSIAATETSAAMHIEGNTGRSTSRGIPNPPGTVLIPIEEVSTNAEFGRSLVNVFNATPGVPGITVGWEGSRVNFLGPASGNFTELVNRGAVIDLGHDNQPTNPAATPIGFLADDTADEIAARMEVAIRAQGFTVSRSGAVLTLSGGPRFDPARTDVPPFKLAGAAPGGLITGMAFVGNTLFAVSDAGGLYRVVNPTAPMGAFLVYVDTAFDLLGINFQALAAGPRNLAGGAFRDILFGIDDNGRIYAFDTNGRLQPVFANGQTFIDTGIVNANGLAFSTLDTNLWHITDRRANDPGHGINAPFDGSRTAQPGGSSFWFGWESQAANNVIVDPFYDPVNSVNTYNFPGGAHGSLISKPFSLEGYSSADAPVLYFNYRLQTENASALLLPTQFMRDAFRVFVGTEDGQWHLVATNNSARGPGFFDDEYDGAITPVQELFDVGDNGAPDSWRQARVDLSPFAGQRNLRLRFDFSTAGAMDIGDTQTGGVILHGVPGRDLRDGQLLLIDNDRFEVDLGTTLVVPTGAAVRDGETFTIHGRTFEFDNNGTVTGTNIPIRFDATQSASALAAIIENILATTDYTLTADLRAETAGNDIISLAVDTGLQGGADIFRSQGRIGDNPNFTVNPGLDVDMVRVNLNAGDAIQVTVRAQALGSPLDPVVRLFDSAGVPLGINDNAPGLGRDSRLTFTAPRSGAYFIGVSGAPNTSYDPVVLGFGTVGSTGDYELEIMVNGFTGVTPRRHDNRIQLDGAVKVSQGPGSMMVIDGAAGVSAGNIPVVVHADMTDAQVAEVVRRAIANRYSGGVLSAFPLDDYRITIVGHSVTAPGPFGLTSSLPGDIFGAFYASKRFDGGTDAFNPGALRAQNNAFEGVFIDDIIIGFAERGEMATGAVATGAFISNPNAPANAVTVGDYQLEIRRSAEYGVANPFAPPAQLLLRSLDTNDRLSQEHTLLAPAAYQVVDGQTFTLSDGVNSVVFEFEDVNLNNGVAPGHVAIPFDPMAFDTRGGRSAESASSLARRIRDAINSPAVQNVLAIRAGLSDGTETGTSSTDSKINLFGNAVVGSLTGSVITGDLSGATEINDSRNTAVQGTIVPGATSTFRASGFIGDNPTLVGLNAGLDVDLLEFQFTAGTTVRIDIDAAVNGSPLDSVIRLFDAAGNELVFSDDDPAPGEPFTVDSYLEFVIPVTGRYFIGVSSFPNFDYDINVSASGTAGFSTGPYTIEVTASSGGIAFRRFDDFGDRNLFRDQGQIKIESTRISRSQQFGINIDGGRRDGPEGNPHQGPPRVTREVNSQRLVPGVVVQNNILHGNVAGGIRFAGTPTVPGQQPGAVPFGRIVNNTIYGLRASDVGILVENNASPTLLNNIVANLGTGISVDSSSASTIIGGMLYQNNAIHSTGSLGSFPIVLQNGDPLFVEPAVGNFYLANGSAAIDSSIHSMADRPALLSVKAPLGIAPSPILAPQRDLLGQLRGDDPAVEPPPGAGENVFIDRGAIDRVDFAGPVGFVLDPRDNDAGGRDLDPRPNRVKLSVISLQGFSIQLIDGIEPGDPNNGTGIDDRSVNGQQLILFRDGQRLVEGVDYRFRYDAYNDVIRLTPIAGIWETNHTYLIRLANKDQFIVTAPPGDQVADGGQFTITDRSGNTVTFEFESGYTVTVAPTLALVMPAAGGGLGGMTDRQTMRISDGTNTVIFEFDNNGSVAAGNRPIVFTPQFSAEQLADAVVQALRAANLNLAPVHLGRGVVHVGVLPNHTVDISNAPSLTLTGSINGGVRDGDIVVLDDGTRVLNFEFDLDGRITSGNTRVAFLQTDTHERIADKFVAAVRANAVGLNPVHLGNGKIHLGGGPLTVLDTSASRLTQVGSPGVRPEFGILIPSQAGRPVGIADGQTFQIGNGVGLPVTFEFDTNNVVVPGNTIVRIPATNPTLDQIANAMVQAITSVGLGLTPVNAGAGRVILNDDTAAHFFNPLTSGLRQFGTPGVPGAVAVTYLPDVTFTAAQMATLISQLINVNTTLQGVSASSQDDQVFVDGASDIRGIVKVFVAGIRDIAGNVIQPNTMSGTTEFVIELGTGFDYGDAPSSLGYPTLLRQNGARHTIVPGFHLGAAIDLDIDGQPTLSADGDDSDALDDEDGVTFGSLVRGYQTTITVVASGITAIQPGRLDAWVDWNQDGDWNDPGEQIAASVPLANGNNVLTVSVPVSARPGTTYARFRLSSTGGLAPFGEALDGEVEDYQVTVVVSPWQNPVRREDVSGDGRVTPFDVLLLLRFLQRHGSVALPVPPPLVTPGGQQIFPTNNMLDVNGDTVASTLDVLDVLRFLRSRGSGEGESVTRAEGEPTDPLSSSLSTQGTSASFLAVPPVSVVGLVPAATQATSQTFVAATTGTIPVKPLLEPSRPVYEVQFRLAPGAALRQAVWAEQEKLTSADDASLDEDLANHLASNRPACDVDAFFAEVGAGEMDALGPLD